MNAILRATGVELRYGSHTAVSGVDFALSPGEVCAIMGSSGSGKSSLLHCLAGVVAPTRGEVSFDGVPLQRLGDDELSTVRRERFGFVFQYGELLPELTVVENAALPLRLAGRRKAQAHEEAGEILGRLGLAEVRQRRTSQISGGQSQRVAVARALVHRPDVVFADEPTGALDSANAEAVLEEFLALARSRGTAVIMVTHDASVASRADSRYTMADGALTGRAVA